MPYQSRVPAGVPAGGEFATSERVENSDLAPEFAGPDFAAPGEGEAPFTGGEGEYLRMKFGTIDIRDRQQAEALAEYRTLPPGTQTQFYLNAMNEQGERKRQFRQMAREYGALEGLGYRLTPEQQWRKDALVEEFAFEAEKARLASLDGFPVQHDHSADIHNFDVQLFDLEGRVFKGRKTRKMIVDLHAWRAESQGRLRAQPHQSLTYQRKQN